MDPWTDGNPAYPKGYRIERVDTICITHGHFDHVHDAIPLAQRFSSEVVAIFETCDWLQSKGVANTRPMNKGGSQKVGEVTVTMTHAVHSCGILDEGKIIYGGEAAGYVLRFADGRALYFAGDTNVFSDMHLIEQIYHPELAFLPIGDLFTMSPREAAVAAKLLRARKIIPMHFGTFPALTGRPERSPGKRWSGRGYGATNLAMSSMTSGATWPGFRYSASVPLPSPVTNRWLSAG
jgi:L-ascorbate metabolism protein UlaG (beta-lactamase superfamily)